MNAFRSAISADPFPRFSGPAGKRHVDGVLPVFLPGQQPVAQMEDAGLPLLAQEGPRSVEISRVGGHSPYLRRPGPPRAPCANSGLIDEACRSGPKTHETRTDKLSSSFLASALLPRQLGGP